MVTLQSKVNPDYSVTIYPISEYKGGNGFWYHKTGNVKDAMSQLEIMRSGNAEVIDELCDEVLEIWRS